MRTTNSGTIADADDAVVVAWPSQHSGSDGTLLAPNGGVGISVTIPSAFVGTIGLDLSDNDGATWHPVQLRKTADDSTVTGATGAGHYYANVIGATHVRAKPTAYTSGAVTVKLTAAVG